MALPAIVLLLSLVADRVIGDPHSRLHPVAILGSFIGFWGRPELYPIYIQRFSGVFLAVFTGRTSAKKFFIGQKLLMYFKT